MLTHVRHRPRRRNRPDLTDSPTRGLEPLVVDLSDYEGALVDQAGAKAANLSIAAAAGLPVLAGVVLTERLCNAIVAATSATQLSGESEAALELAWRTVGGGDRALVVRSSSRAEDGAESSLAGRFTSVLDVRGFDQFVDAVDEVVRSAWLISLDDAESHRAPMAVLVQPQLDAVAGGVMFGIDPVSGRTDRLVVAAVAGGPDRLVSGLESGTTHVLSRRGKLLSFEGEGLRLGSALRHRLARLAADTAEVFGCPQDVEWAVDADGSLWLLQSRPITTASRPAPARAGRVFGPGPVAETFPAALAPLEQDLWLSPLNTALTEALVLTGLASRRRMRAMPPLIEVGGFAAVDLDVLGASPLRRSIVARLNPVPPARRVRAAWRTGRLRAALPALASDCLVRADAELATVAPPAKLSLRQLLAVIDGSHQALVSLHGYEVLIGLLATDATDDTNAAAGRAVRALAEGRAAGMTDAQIIADHPVVLSLVPPSIRPATLLPETPPGAYLDPARRRGVPHSSVDVTRSGLGQLREELRLRVRWLQELTAVVSWEIGTRLHAAGTLPAAGAVRWLWLEELRAAMTRADAVPDLSTRRSGFGMGLPAAFRLGADGQVTPLEAAAARDQCGKAAGGGRVTGTVFGGSGLPPAGSILVVRNLDPALATVLPHLGGLVAETGSVLSHLAILAREFGVAIVVGVPGAVERFPAGTSVLVDGSTGEVKVE